MSEEPHPSAATPHGRLPPFQFSLRELVGFVLFCGVWMVLVAYARTPGFCIGLLAASYALFLISSRQPRWVLGGVGCALAVSSPFIVLGALRWLDGVVCQEFGWSWVEFPDENTMRLSHATAYVSLQCGLLAAVNTWGAARQWKQGKAIQWFLVIQSLALFFPFVWIFKLVGVLLGFTFVFTE